MSLEKILYPIELPLLQKKIRKDTQSYELMI